MLDMPPRDRNIAWLVFGFLLACYLITYTGIIQSSDGLAMFATTESIARRGEADMNQLLWMGNQQGSFGPDGDLYSRKGLGMTLLALPLVWLALVLKGLGVVKTALLLNPLITAITGALVYRAGVRLGWQRATAVSTALIFGLATLAWPYTQEFFSDPVCGFALFASFYGLLAFAQTGSKWYLVLGGIAWGIAYLARSVNLVTLPVYLVGLYVVLDLRVRLYRRTYGSTSQITWRRVFKYQWRPLVSFLIPVVLSGILSLWWNWARFGSVWETGYVATESFSAPWLFGLYGLLAGPARGFFWYNPILLLAIPGALWFWRHSRRTLLIVLALTAIYFLLYGKWYMWHGGSSWGPRFLVPLTPFLALLCGPAWERLVIQRRWGWAGAALGALLLMLSVGVQWLGMVIPFSLVQDWLATHVQPLYAPETFTQLRYSPLWLQWDFLARRNVVFAWWSNGAGWLQLLPPLLMALVGAVLLLRQARAGAGDKAGSKPRNLVYLVALAGIMFLIPAWYFDPRDNSATSVIAAVLDSVEQPEYAILFLKPEDTQQFANLYTGRLGVWGHFDLPNDSVNAARVDAELARMQGQGISKLWVVPNGRSSDNSAWEARLRTNHYLLTEIRPGRPMPRLALYALDDGQQRSETGLGTIFGDPDSPEAVNESNGWIRLAGYRLTQETTAHGEILLTLRWESLRPVTYNYHVFVHLLDSTGKRIAQRDGQPVQWLRPTSTWVPGEEIADRYSFRLETALSPGRYDILVGLYDPVSGQRLPVSAGPEDFAIQLGPVTVLP